MFRDELRAFRFLLLPGGKNVVNVKLGANEGGGESKGIGVAEKKLTFDVGVVRVTKLDVLLLTDIPNRNLVP